MIFIAVQVIVSYKGVSCKVYRTPWMIYIIFNSSPSEGAPSNISTFLKIQFTSVETSSQFAIQA